MTGSTQYRVRLDDKRRPTLPQALLDEAGVSSGQELVATMDGPGRIVLQGPDAVLAHLQSVVREGREARGNEGSLTDELLAQRQVDAARQR